jgi:hypothetical protein
LAFFFEERSLQQRSLLDRLVFDFLETAGVGPR